MNLLCRKDLGIKITTMKLFALFLAIAVFISPLIFAFPPKGRDCENNCELQDFKPICGTDDKGDIKTFNNYCILKTENCLRNQNYQKTADGECP